MDDDADADVHDTPLSKALIGMNSKRQDFVRKILNTTIPSHLRHSTRSSSSRRSSSASFSPSYSSLSPKDALDLLHVTGHSDEGGGYLQLSDNQALRSQARALIAAGLEDGSAFALLRRVLAMGQQEAKGPIMGHVMQAGCGARPTDGAAVDEEGAWAASEEWWSYQQEIAMCHEVIDELMAARG